MVHAVHMHLQGEPGVSVIAHVVSLASVHTIISQHYKPSTIQLPFLSDVLLHLPAHAEVL